MRKATRRSTTTRPAPDQAPPIVADLKAQALRQRYTISDPVTGDALLIALAAEYREADRIGVAFDEAATAETGKLHTYLSRVAAANYKRRAQLEQAICVVPATDLAGAMIQVEALAQLPMRAPDEEADMAEALRNLACESVFRVLSRLTGRTADDGLAMALAAGLGQLVGDVAEHKETLHAFFTRYDLTPTPTPTAATEAAS